jgi:hypothetical protein
MTSSGPRHDRRTFALAVAGGLGSLLLPRGVRAGQPYRVLIIGSSQIGGGLGLYLEQ